MNEFEKMIRQDHRLVTVDILYWMPDHQNILQEFWWQTMDNVPKLPRIHRFLDYWQKNIDAKINEIKVAHCDPLSPTEYRSVEDISHLFN